MSVALPNALIWVGYVTLLVHPVMAGGRSRVVLRDNGYRNLVVAITENVPQDDWLLTRIIAVFTEMSEYLYQATRKRAYLHDITVLIPKSWTSVNRATKQALTMTAGDSDIRIGTLDARIGDAKDKPVVFKVSPCGQVGQFMYLSPRYIYNSSLASKYGPYGKALVHSWAHLRYGVFDEYPSDDLNNYFYPSDELTIEATRCSREIKGLYNVASMSVALPNALIWVGYVTLLVHPVMAGGRSRVVLRDNGYRNLVVAITENVPQDDWLLTRIIAVFTEMSEYLYQATRKRAYLHDITVLIPKSWTSVNRATKQALTMTAGDSDIRIGTLDARIGDAKDKPVVFKVSPCGQVGQFMYLSPRYIYNSSLASKYGPYGKALVHSWAHLRYGVFDEYPSDDLNNYFYPSDELTIEATRCSREIKGTLYDKETGAPRCQYVNGFPDKNCRFRDDSEQEGKFGSLMYRQYLDYIDGFCDNDSSDPLTLHNQMSPSKQNLMCDGKSVWEVLRLHGDFDGRNPPRNVTSTVPNFIFAKHVPRRTVLVLDISDSMRKYKRIQQLRQAARLYLMDFVENGERVGMVVFNHKTAVKFDLVSVNDQLRKTLVKKIPHRVNGYTGIGKAILRGISVLSVGGREKTKGGNIILLTDGMENKKPKIQQITKQITDSGVIINTIALSRGADHQLESLATLTGGTSFFYSENASSNALNDAFVEMSERGKSMSQKRVTLKSSSTILDHKKHKLVNDVIIDSTVGSKPKFSISYTEAEVDVTVTSPSGKITRKGQPGYSVDRAFKTITVEPKEFEAGAWKYSVAQRSSQKRPQKVMTLVTSRVSHGENNPVMAEARWAKSEVTFPEDIQILYVAVSKGYAPILRASVKAFLERPKDDPVILQLRDNGAGADITKDDGVYSCYATQFSRSGRYNVKVTVNSFPATVVRHGRIVASSSGTSMASTNDNVIMDKAIGSFQRVLAPGSFRVKNFTSDVDYIAPSKVTDLRLASYDSVAKVISLQWTAVGDNEDDGTVKRYELWTSTNFANISAGNVRVVAGRETSSLRRPLNSGETQSYDYTIKKQHKDSVTFYFRVRGEDNAGNWGKPSNIVAVYVEPTPKPNPMGNSNKNDTLSLGAIVGIVLGSIAALLLIVLGAALMVMKCKKETSFYDIFHRNRPVECAKGVKIAKRNNYVV